MKKRYLFLIGLFFFFLCESPVNASFYYETNDGNYKICVDDDRLDNCTTLKKGEDGAIFDGRNKQIIYHGITYDFSPYVQESYNNNVNASTSMLYYINKKGNYVLCENLDSCHVYSFDDLLGMGASINAKKNVTLYTPDGTELIYYYNAEIESQASSGKDPGKVVEDTTKPLPVEYPTTGVCEGKIKEPLKFIGKIVLIVKIAIPIIIIIFGVVDFFRAITGAKDDEIKKSARSLLFRVLAGVIIFLIPTIISVVFSLIDSWANIKGDFNACQKCILRVTECK